MGTRDNNPTQWVVMWIELYNVYKALSPAHCSSLLQLEQWHLFQWSLLSVQCRTEVKQQLCQSEIWPTPLSTLNLGSSVLCLVFVFLVLVT